MISNVIKNLKINKLYRFLTVKEVLKKTWQSRGRRFEPDLLHKGFQTFYLETLFICTQF